MTLTQIAVFGDSLAQGTGAGGLTPSTAQGGPGNWVEIFAEALATVLRLPLVSPGLRGLWSSAPFLAGGDDQWAKTGTWTKSASSDAWDRGPYGYVYKAVGGLPKYRVDGGTFVNFPTVTADNRLHRFYVSSSVATSVEVATQDGTKVVTWTKPTYWRDVVGFAIDYVAIATDTAVLGITPYFIAPQGAAGGLIVHDLAANGNRLNFLAAATSGDRLAWVDDVTLDPVGAPIAHTPNAGTLLLHINDVAIASTATWAADLAVFFGRVGPHGPVVFLNPWEAATVTYNQAQQTAYRAQTKTSAGTLGATVLDFYDEYAAKGIVGNAATQAAGLLVDAIHQSLAGHADQGARVYGYVRQNLFTVGPATRVFRAGASSAGGTDHLGGAPSFVGVGAQAVEVDTALAGTTRSSIGGAQAVEVDLALAGGPRVALAGTQALEVDAAQAGTPHLEATGGLAVEVDLALAGALELTVAGTLADEVDEAFAGTVTINVVVNGAQALEVDEAFAGTIVAGGNVFGHQALEVDEALPGTVVVHLTVNGTQALEVDEALAGTVRFIAGVRNLAWSSGPPTLGEPFAATPRSRWAAQPARNG